MVQLLWDKGHNLFHYIHEDHICDSVKVDHLADIYRQLDFLVKSVGCQDAHNFNAFNPTFYYFFLYIHEFIRPSVCNFFRSNLSLNNKLFISGGWCPSIIII